MTILNHITLDALVRLPMSEIVGLPAAELARLQKEAEDALRKAKLTVAWLNGALSQKYAEPAKAARAEAETCSQARAEGAMRMLRTGIISETKRILRNRRDLERQTDFADRCDAFAPLVSDLRSKSYFVESAEEYVAVPDLIAEPDLLDDARRFMRRKGLECLAEANRLDALYTAVTGNGADAALIGEVLA